MQKNKQWICYFIALFIFMSGMCFENVKTDSLFLRASEEGTVYVSLTGSEASCMEARTEEIAGANRTSRIIGIQNQSVQLRRTVRLFCSYILSLAGIALAHKFYTTEERLLQMTADGQAVVVNYIHNIDGKKRI